MTLSLEQVRQTRFHLARRNGYEPMDVDNFVDKVEVTLQQLGEENETLKQQLDALTAFEMGKQQIGRGEYSGRRSGRFAIERKRCGRSIGRGQHDVHGVVLVRAGTGQAPSALSLDRRDSPRPTALFLSNNRRYMQICTLRRSPAS